MDVVLAVLESIVFTVSFSITSYLIFFKIFNHKFRTVFEVAAEHEFDTSSEELEYDYEPLNLGRLDTVYELYMVDISQTLHDEAYRLKIDFSSLTLKKDLLPTVNLAYWNQGFVENVEKIMQEEPHLRHLGRYYTGMDTSGLIVKQTYANKTMTTFGFGEGLTTARLSEMNIPGFSAIQSFMTTTTSGEDTLTTTEQGSSSGWGIATTSRFGYMTATETIMTTSGAVAKFGTDLVNKISGALGTRDGSENEDEEDDDDYDGDDGMIMSVWKMMAMGGKKSNGEQESYF